MQLGFLIAYCSFGSVIIPLSIALLHLKRMSIELKSLFLILMFSLISDLISILLAKYSPIVNTYIIINIYLVVQFSLLAYIFRSQFDRKKVVDVLVVILLLFFLLNMSFFQGPLTFNSVSNVVASLVIIGFCLIYLYQLLNDLPIIYIHQLPMLWISFAVLTYYGGNFFLFLIKNYLTYGDTGSHKLMWILHNLLNIIKNILFAVALWQSYRQARQFTLSSSAP